MGQYSDIKGSWGDALHLVHIDKSIEHLVPEETIKVLTIIGLPFDNQCADFRLIFFEYPRAIEFLGAMYFQIGTYYDIPIAINTTGEVIQFIEMPPEFNKPPVVFMNSSIEFFLRFLSLYFSQRPEILSLTNSILDDFSHLPSEQKWENQENLRKKLRKISSSMRAKFMEIDQKSLSDINNFWAELLFGWDDV